ncbi:MAG: hypothetical protein ACYTF8_09055 [Planctomycetota bacterium]|jgi:predicted hotdog family 3-hydroxylacyl-ACP dehydratase
MDASEQDPTAVIPHRPPILCIDRIVETAREHAVAERVVREGSDVDAGELWEEALVEGLAQTAAVLNAFADREQGRKSGKGMLVGVRKFDITRRARLGERILFRVELIRRITPLTLMRCEARCGDEILARGEMKFYVEEEA